MKFNLWFVFALALLPVFALFVGMSVADDFPSLAGWDLLVAIAIAIAMVVGLTRRRSDRDEDAAGAIQRANEDKRAQVSR